MRSRATIASTQHFLRRRTPWHKQRAVEPLCKDRNCCVKIKRTEIYKNAVDMPCTLRVFVFQVHLIKVLNVWLWLYVLRASTRTTVYVIFRMPVVDILEHEWTVVFCRLNRDSQREPPLFSLQSCGQKHVQSQLPFSYRMSNTPISRLYHDRFEHIDHLQQKQWTVQPIISKAIPLINIETFLSDNTFLCIELSENIWIRASMFPPNKNNNNNNNNNNTKQQH